MTKRLAAAVCLLLTLACAPVFAQQQPASPPAAAWEKFAPAGGNFSVLLPGKPAEETKTEASPHGPYTVHIFTAKAPGEIFLVGWVDYDPAFKFGTQAELEANRDNFVKAVKATVLSSNPVKLGQHPGLEFTAESEQAFVRSRVYIIGRRPYQLFAIRAKGAEESANVGRFFSSFSVPPAR